MGHGPADFLNFWKMFGRATWRALRENPPAHVPWALAFRALHWLYPHPQGEGFTPTLTLPRDPPSLGPILLDPSPIPPRSSPIPPRSPPATPGPPKTAPRPPQDRPKTPQDRAKTPQDRPKAHKTHPRAPRSGPQPQKSTDPLVGSWRVGSDFLCLPSI